MMKIKNANLSTRSILAIGMVVVVFLHLPFFILGEQSYLRIHDNLDSDFIYIHLLKISNHLFGWDSSTPVMNVFDGLPRGYFHSEYSFLRVLFYLLPSFWAYVLNSVLVRFLAFVGVCLLARDYFHLKESKHVLLVLLFAAVFSLLPTFTIYGASVFGQALLLWAFLNLLHQQKQGISFVIVAVYPFYAHFILVGIFVLAAVVLIALVQLIGYKKPLSWSFCLAGVLLFGLFLVANHSLLFDVLLSDTPTHRDEMVLPTNSAWEIISNIWSQLAFGVYHSSNMTTWPLGLLMSYLLIKYNKTRPILALLFFLIIAIVVFDNLYRPLVNTFLADVGLLKKAQLNRFGTLLPTCWILLVLQLVKSNLVKPVWVGLSIVLLIPFSRLPIFEIGVNWIRLMTNVEYVEHKYPGFDSFYAPELFDDIDQYINQPKEAYRVVSVGMHPSVALYNGFYTLDAYQNVYPLSYKTKFRGFIAGELDKNETLQKYFDDWGHRSYIFVDALKKTCYLDCHKKTNLGIVDVDLNVDLLRKNNVQYIFSTVELQNKVIPLVLDKVVENNKSRWKIYLYKL